MRPASTFVLLLACVTDLLLVHANSHVPDRVRARYFGDKTQIKPGSALRAKRELQGSSPSISTKASFTRPASGSSKSTGAASDGSSTQGGPTSYDWMILPEDGHAEANQILTLELESIFGDRMYICQNSVTGIVYWGAPLTPEQVAYYRSLSIVRSCPVVALLGMKYD